jgi:ribosomal protein S27AE
MPILLSGGTIDDYHEITRQSMNIPEYPTQTPTSAPTCECGKELVPDAKFCPECGKATASATTCECGGKIVPEARFCPDCGKAVAGV